MSLIDRLEKLGRLILWLTIALVLIAVPTALAKQGRAEAEARAALQKAEGQLAEALKPKKPERLSIRSMGMYMSGLNRQAGTGELWFTNASAHVGVLCIEGAAVNADTKAIAKSMAACHDVGAYASGVHVTMMFAGKDLADVCSKATCALVVSDAVATD